MYDFHLHLARLPQPRTVAQALLDQNYRFNAIACEPWEWEILQKMEDRLFEGSCRYYGIHPIIANDMEERDWERLEALLDNFPEAGVGEAGIDKRYEGYEESGAQEEAFRRQVELALKYNRDLQIHCVGDYGRIVKILKECGYPKKGSPARPVFHRFGGDISVVKSAQCLNPIFSLHRDSFRKKSTLASLPHIPTEQVRIETDADETFYADKKVTVEETVAALKKELSSVQDALAGLSSIRP